MTDSLKRNRTLVILSVLLIVTGIFAFTQYRRAQKLTYFQNVEYNRVFSELSESVDDLEISLLKGQVVSGDSQLIKLSADLYGQASSAKANLALLPMKGQTLAKTSEFLAQVGEYANSLSDKMLRGEEISQKEITTMQELLEYSRILKKAFDKMLVDINEGKISFSDDKSISGRLTGAKASISGELSGLEEEFHDYPSLIYDGPFSQHLAQKESVFLKGKAEISQKQAIKKARTLTGEEAKSVTEIKGKTPSYSVKGKNSVAEFSKKGGALLIYMKDRVSEEEKISLKNARQSAQRFLRENGFFDMAESYYEKKDGSVVINYAYKQDEYTVFPDLVKVKVALDNGEVIGFESLGYVTNHIYRQIPEEKISREEALAKVGTHLKTESVTKAIIPLDDGSEKACWQIQGTVSDRHFLMYVNTQTGDIEDVQILLESDGGTLAV